MAPFDRGEEAWSDTSRQSRDTPTGPERAEVDGETQPPCRPLSPIGGEPGTRAARPAKATRRLPTVRGHRRRRARGAAFSHLPPLTGHCATPPTKRFHRTNLRISSGTAGRYGLRFGPRKSYHGRNRQSRAIAETGSGIA